VPIKGVGWLSIVDRIAVTTYYAYGVAMSERSLREEGPDVLPVRAPTKHLGHVRLPRAPVGDTDSLAALRESARAASDSLKRATPQVLKRP